MSRILSLLISIQLVFAPLAQAEVKAFFDADSIWGRYSVIVDGKEVEHHFFYQWDLREAMKSNPAALEYAERAYSQSLWGSTLMWSGLGAALAYGVTRNTPKDFDPGTYWSIFLVGFLPGVFLLSAGHLNTIKAMNAYNGLKYNGMHWSGLSLAPSPNGGVAALNWSF